MANVFPNDAGRKIVDEQLKKLESHLSALYKQAAKECQDELDAYLKRFAIRDRHKRELLANGTITKEDYKEWQKRQIFHTRQMQAKVIDLSKRLVNADKDAMAMINKQLPETYATSYNWGGFRGEKFAQAAGFDYTQFTIINKDAVRVLATEDPDLIPWQKVPDDQKDKEWNRKHIQQAIEQGIVQGDGIDKISKRLLPVVNMDEVAARRTARTAVNSIENKGRKDATQRVKDAGIPMQEVWSCTHDSRTRDTHILLDGTYPNEEGFFGEGILDRNHLMQYPGDTNGEAKEVYNCRCRLNSFIAEIDHSKDTELYEQFMSENYEQDWEQVKIDRQSKELAYQANKKGAAERVEKAKQRAEAKTQQKESAPAEKEPLPKADDLLPAENLKTDQSSIVDGKYILDTWERRENEFEFEIDDAIDAQGFNGLPQVVSAEEFDKAVKESGFIAQRTYSAESKEVLDEYQKQLYEGNWYVSCSVGGAQYGQGMYCAADYTGKLSQGIKEEMLHYQELNKEKGNPYYNTETLTLDPSAKIISHSALIQLQNDKESEFIFNEQKKIIKDIAEKNKLTDEDKKWLIIQSKEYSKQTADEKEFLSDYFDKVKENGTESGHTLKDMLGFSSKTNSTYLRNTLFDNSKEFRQLATMDKGVFATLNGYDAINAEGHGESGSYTVILNRTKVIFRKGG